MIHCCEAEYPIINEVKDEIWERILKCAAVYLDKPEQKDHSLSKSLPKTRSEGYYSSCYKRFTSIPSSATTSTAPTP